MRRRLSIDSLGTSASRQINSEQFIGSCLRFSRLTFACFVVCVFFVYVFQLLLLRMLLLKPSEPLNCAAPYLITLPTFSACLVSPFVVLRVLHLHVLDVRGVHRALAVSLILMVFISGGFSFFLGCCSVVLIAVQPSSLPLVVFVDFIEMQLMNFRKRIFSKVYLQKSPPLTQPSLPGVKLLSNLFSVFHRRCSVYRCFSCEQTKTKKQGSCRCCSLATQSR